jgi:hypothetical protein
MRKGRSRSWHPGYPIRQFDAVVVTNYLWRALMPSLIQRRARRRAFTKPAEQQDDWQTSRPDFFTPSASYWPLWALRWWLMKMAGIELPGLQQTQPRFVQQIWWSATLSSKPVHTRSQPCQVKPPCRTPKSLLMLGRMLFRDGSGSLNTSAANIKASIHTWIHYYWQHRCIGYAHARDVLPTLRQTGRLAHRGRAQTASACQDHRLSRHRSVEEHCEIIQFLSGDGLKALQNIVDDMYSIMWPVAAPTQRLGDWARKFASKSERFGTGRAVLQLKPTRRSVTATSGRSQKLWATSCVLYNVPGEASQTCCIHSTALSLSGIKEATGNIERCAVSRG